MTAEQGPPPRPPPWEERLTNRALRLVVPLARRPIPEPPESFLPYERHTIRRPDGGALDATWYPAEGEARGAVLLAHPWVEWGQSYFHRRGRVEALRAAGYHAMTFDAFGLGASDPPRGYSDRDMDVALGHLALVAGDLPLHAWGVSSGAYWLHVALARRDACVSAVFEDVTPHLVEWATLARPWLRAPAALLRRAFPRADRFIDLRRHAPHLRVRAAAYAWGARDAGIPERDARELARLAGADALVVPDADHLGAIKVATADVIGLALATFERGLKA